MGLQYRDLDQRTRSLMLSEIQHDLEHDTLYLSDNLNPRGRADYPGLLQDAARDGNDDSLASALRSRLNPTEKPRRLKSGGYSKPPKMRRNAHEMLAEGEFNRFYIRALCLRAIEDGIPSVVMYRAKAVRTPRPNSEAKIGQSLPVEALLEDLRTNTGVDTALGLPAGPNSGLSVQLP